MNKNLLYLLIFAFGMMLLPAEDAINEDLSALIRNKIDGKMCVFKLTEKDIQNGPKWDLSKITPDFGPRQALQAAKKFIERFPDSNKWKLKRIALENCGMNDWYYLVTFDIIYGSGAEGVIPTFRVPMLLSGEIIEPKFEPLE